jgi:2-oxoglutarate/2-oxoacid ferredoxin oxidoreductase subunit beta
MQGLKKDWEIEPCEVHHEPADYAGALPRWCPGCGDHTALNAVRRLCYEKQLPPERTVVVSGIGCSSRFPHYMKTYGFHGLHGRAFPVACGVKSRRPDLHVFVVTGDGDCCAIGAGHWIHALRYNMDLTVILLDNNIYGLTKNQTSPTTRLGEHTNTHPRGAVIPPLNPLTVALGIANASFVAQTVDWNPSHVYSTLCAAQEHRGTSFVRILQRCPHFSAHVFDAPLHDPSLILLMEHEQGVPCSPDILKRFPNRVDHDPGSLERARALAAREDVYPIGLFYRDERASCYDDFTSKGLSMTQPDRQSAVRAAIEKFAI